MLIYHVPTHIKTPRHMNYIFEPVHVWLLLLCDNNEIQNHHYYRHQIIITISRFRIWWFETQCVYNVPSLFLKFHVYHNMQYLCASASGQNLSPFSVYCVCEFPWTIICMANPKQILLVQLVHWGPLKFH